MEGVPGIDVSWLHHNAAQKDLRKATSKASSKQSSKTSSRAPSPPHDRPPPLPTDSAAAAATATAPPPQPPPQNAPAPSTSEPIPIRPQDNSKSAAKNVSKRGSLLQRGSSERLSGSSIGSSPEDTRTPARTGWIRNLSSKFSSQEKTPTLASQSAGSQAASTTAKGVPTSTPAVSERAAANAQQDPSVSQQSKPNSSFLSSALRRLSSSNNTSAPAKPAPTGTVCPRRLLNVDKQRERCRVPELKEARLRRVAFSVDVEVAGVSRYIEESEAVEPATKARDKKIQARSEGEALKNPKTVVERKETGETASSIVNGPASPQRSSLGSVDDMLENELLAAAKKQEHRESIARRRQEKEEKRKQQAVEGDSTAMDSSSDLPNLRPPPIDTGRRSFSSQVEDRPTTDPLRMYRRCCQLREAPVLKRISEQLSNMKPEVEKTGYVPVLDLNGSRLQLTDFCCLGDWLAIVPVKKLLMDNANLSDEGLRIVLAGLLSTRPPDTGKSKSPLPSPAQRKENNVRRPHGVIEKLSLRLNHKITVEGWKHLCLFLNLSSSLRAIDVSLTPLPRLERPADGTETPNATASLATILRDAIATRPSKFSRIEELILSECKLSTDDVGKVVDAACIGRIDRLGLAKNDLKADGIEHVKRFAMSEGCGGIDLGGNDLRDSLATLVSALHPKSPLYALCLANCNLDATALAKLLPTLAQLPDMRVLILSHNRDLFKSPNSVGFVRKYLPKYRKLRRIDLTDVSLSPQDAIAIADILPDVRNLNHVGVGENPEIRRLSTAPDAASQEEACALYGSLMVAVRISKTLMAVEIEVPSKESSDIVQALAKQIVAYAFRNVERYTATDAIYSDDPASKIPDTIEEGKDVPVPDLLLHLVGNAEDDVDHPGELDIKKHPDYIMGGTGVVKALSYVLGQKTDDFRRMSGAFSGNSSPSHPSTPGSEEQNAREMSRNLLNSARKIRARLQLTMVKEGESADELTQRRLQFLDHTLAGMIERFENVYPDCALPTNEIIRQYPFRHHNPVPASGFLSFTPQDHEAAEMVDTDAEKASTHSRASSTASSNPSGVSAVSALSGIAKTEPVPENAPLSESSSRRGSSTNLAARAQANEEGRMHRFGQRFRREVLPPKGSDDHYHRTSKTDNPEEPHLAVLRSRLEAMDSDELRDKVIRNGLESTVREYSDEAERLRRDSAPNLDLAGIAASAAEAEGGREEALSRLEGASSGDA